MTVNATITATPSKDNGYFYVVEAEHPHSPFYLAGVGTPKGEPVGAKGKLTYHSSRSGGRWIWETT